MVYGHIPLPTQAIALNFFGIRIPSQDSLAQTLMVVNEKAPNSLFWSRVAFSWSHRQSDPASLVHPLGPLITQSVAAPTVEAAQKAKMEAEEKVEMRNGYLRFLGTLIRPVRVFARFLHLFVLYFPVITTLPWWIYVNRRALFAEDENELVIVYEWWLHLLVKTLEWSGPTFIKLGQYASSRTDVFPPQVCKILSRLQSSVKPHALSETKRSLRDQLDIDIDKVFEWFDPQPIGVGAIAQVYKARLRINPSTGESTVCAVKNLAFDRKNNRLFVSDARWLSLPDELAMFATMMRSQADMKTEATNLDRFRYNFRKVCQVDFPAPIRPYVSRDVLVEEYVDAVPVTKFLELGPSVFDENIAEIGIRSFLKMLVIDNFAHADLHPGNIYISFQQPLTSKLETKSMEELCLIKDPSEWKEVMKSLKHQGVKPQVIFLDAGLVSELSPAHLTNFTDLLSAVVAYDGIKIAQLMVSRSRDPSTCSDLEGFEKDMEKLMDKVRGQTLRLSRFTFSAILNSVFDMVRKYRVRLEGDFANVGIAVMLVEGIGRRLDPMVDLLAEAGPVLRKMSGDDSGSDGSIANQIKSKAVFADLWHFTNKVKHAMTDIKEASAKFWTEFQADFRVLKNDVSSASQDAATLANLRKGVMALEKRVMDASIFLPAYDQRQCNIQIQEISEKLNSMSKPRAKFSFGSGRTRAGGAVASIAQSIKDVAAAKENAVTKSANVEEDASSILNGTRIVGVRSAYISRNGPLTDGHDFHLHDIDDCVVDLRSETHISAIHARHIKNSIIIQALSPAPF
ncbi:hypothetical protein BC829DRAFT_418292 [Chytridium lagenaria]|nr:hypothetical protein BC829DRAFT_418292 [Chytridium lagenaria]